MKKCPGTSAWSVPQVALVALVALACAGCCNGSRNAVVPNKPPLSAEAAKQKAEKQHRDRIKALREQANRKRSH